MNINTVLFITTLLSIMGNYKGVQCSSLTEYHMLFTEDLIGTYHQKCFISVLYSICFFGYPTMPIEKRTDIINLYHRLLRVYNITEKTTGLKLFEVYRFLKEGQSNVMSHLSRAAIEALNIIGGNQSTEENYVNMMVTLFNSCNKQFIQYSQPSIFLEETLNVIFMSQGRRIINPGDNEDNFIFPDEVTFGHILLLLKPDEQAQYFSYNEAYRRIFIIDLMREALVNIYGLVNYMLDSIALPEMDNKMFQEIQAEESPNGYALTILKSIYPKIVVTTIELYSILENRAPPSMVPVVKKKAINIYIQFEHFWKKFLAKWHHLSPNSTNIQSSRFQDYLNKLVSNDYSGRLTNLNEAGNYKFRLSVYEYYSVVCTGIFHTDAHHLATGNKSVMLLLESYVWIDVLLRYGKKINAMKSLPKRQIASIDRKFESMFQTYNDSLKP